VDVLSIVLGVSTAITGGGSVLLWLETHGVGSREKRDKQIDARIAPVKAELQEVRTKVESENSHTATVVRDAMHEALQPIHEQLTILTTRVEPLWEAARETIIRNAKVVHQPDPRRYHIDALLDKLVASVEGGPLLTTSEERELRHYLTLIQDWEPGKDVGFPVHPGEPASAAAILGSMGIIRASRKQGRK
jgi:hypothetical protein